MIFHYNTDKFDTLRIDYSPEEYEDAERMVSEFALAMSTFTIKFMQDVAEEKSHPVLKEVLLEMYEEYLNDWMSHSQTG